jgi:3-oxoacyl-[acyl-carrier-protein] synthase II
LGDRGETKAVKQALGDRARQIPISATKSMIGHTLGAAGGIESVASVLMMKHGVVHPTINLDQPDEGCDLDYVPHTAREHRISALLKNSFGFGGHNASLCFRALA